MAARPKACSHCRKGHHRTCSGKASILTTDPKTGQTAEWRYVDCSCSAAGHHRTKIPPK